MPLQPARSHPDESNQPILHELPPLRFEGESVPLRVSVRRSEDGMWRGRLLFGAAETEGERATAEIFCATSEEDLWQSVRDLREHHLRDLYRSLR